MRRYASPNEIANTVVWLCSDQASYVTGASMPIDGGRCASRARREAAGFA